MIYKTSFLLTNVKDGEGRLQMRVKGEGVYTINLGYVVEVGKWDSQLQSCCNNTSHSRKKITASEINRKIRNYRRMVSEIADSLPEESGWAQFSRQLDIAFGREKRTESQPVYPALLRFIHRESILQQWTENTCRKYWTLLYSLRLWKDPLTFAELDGEGLEDYYVFLVNDGKKNVTIEKYLKSLNCFLKWADAEGEFNVAPDYRSFKPRVKTIPKTIVWLTWDEVMLLYNADVSKIVYHQFPGYAQIRDMFCFSCFTGMRYSDIVSLRHADIRDGKIFLSIKKTGEVVTIELNKYSRAILEKYKDNESEFALPQYHNATCNRELKVICKFIGLDEPTTVVDMKGAERVQETKPKWAFVTMHTGRRSFICNALEKGVSPNVVMKWTGHKSYDEMRPYIDISDKAKENAMKVFDD